VRRIFSIRRSDEQRATQVCEVMTLCIAPKKKPRIHSGDYVLIFVFFLEQPINIFGL